MTRADAMAPSMEWVMPPDRPVRAVWPDTGFVRLTPHFFLSIDIEVVHALGDPVGLTLGVRGDQLWLVPDGFGRVRVASGSGRKVVGRVPLSMPAALRRWLTRRLMRDGWAPGYYGVVLAPSPDHHGRGLCIARASYTADDPYAVPEVPE